MKTQTERIIARMLRGWSSTLDLQNASGSLTPLARLSEWRKQNMDIWEPTNSHYPCMVYLIHGKEYEEITRTRKILNRDGKAVQITERKFVKVK